MFDPKTVTDLDLRAQLEAALAENKALKEKKANAQKISCKVGEKGAMSVYHGSRFPVTLYKSQWENLLTDENIAFIKQKLIDFKDQLKTRE